MDSTICRDSATFGRESPPNILKANQLVRINSIQEIRRPKNGRDWSKKWVWEGLLYPDESLDHFDRAYCTSVEDSTSFVNRESLMVQTVIWRFKDNRVWQPFVLLFSPLFTSYPCCGCVCGKINLDAISLVRMRWMGPANRLLCLKCEVVVFTLALVLRTHLARLLCTVL